MAKIAVDVVLLPPPEIMDLCIEINCEANKKTPLKALLGLDHTIPHMTLLMGVLSTDNLEKAVAQLANLAKEFSRVEVSLDHVGAYGGLNAVRTPEMQRLHETVIDRISPLFTRDVTPDMFVPHPAGEVPIKHLDYLNEFVTHHSYEHFLPHITLHTTDIGSSQLPIDFTADRLALSHNGNYNTCQKILFEYRLTGNRD